MHEIPSKSGRSVEDFVKALEVRKFLAFRMEALVRVLYQLNGHALMLKTTDVIQRLVSIGERPLSIEWIEPSANDVLPNASYHDSVALWVAFILPEMLKLSLDDCVYLQHYVLLNVLHARCHMD